MPNNPSLLSEFSPQSKEEWLAKIEKDLKGGDLSKLTSTLEEGIYIQPVYTKADIDNTDQPFKDSPSWETVQEILVINEKQANQKALDNLNSGANSLLFFLGAKVDFDILLKGILPQYIALHFITEGNGLEIWQKFQNFLSANSINKNDIKGSINIDCFENLARTGNWFRSEVDDLNEVKELTQALPDGFKGVCINAHWFSNAGTTLSQQLGIALSMAYEYIHKLELKNGNPFWFNFAVGSNYFGEISKLRAFRRLWELLQKELALEVCPAHIYTENAVRNKPIVDGYNNMIRSSAEGMAAVIGGCDELNLRGFDQTYKEPNEFGERIARNQSLMLQHESHLDAVKDIAQGSYFIESLTEELAQKGWEFFKAIEEQGGYIQALKKGWLQNGIEQSAQAEQKAYNENQKILIGANKHSKEENLNELATHPQFSHIPENTLVKPIIARRLSENQEKELMS